MKPPAVGFNPLHAFSIELRESPIDLHANVVDLNSLTN